MDSLGLMLTMYILGNIRNDGGSTDCHKDDITHHDPYMDKMRAHIHGNDRNTDSPEHKQKRLDDFIKPHL